MARIRTIKPEFWKHEGLSELPEATHMLAAALLNYSDDFGFFNANPKLVQSECCPLREPSVSVPESLRSLQTLGYVRIGTGPDGKRYGEVVGFNDHQRVSHPSPSKISDKSIVWDVSGISPEIFVRPPETFVPEQGTGNGKEQGTGNREHRAAIAPQISPSHSVSRETPEMEIPNFLVREPNGKRWPVDRAVPPEWIIEAELKRKVHELPPVNLRLEAEKFVNYWTARSGKDATKKDWKATWMNRALSVEPPRGGAPKQVEDWRPLKVVG